MELLQLKYFMVVARLENMSKAAEELNIAQPAVSQSIKRLENELGVLLFERKGRRIILNEAGKFVKNKLAGPLDEIDQLPRALLAHTKTIKAHLSILVLSGSVLILELIKNYRDKYPNVEITLSHNASHSDYDICITSIADVKFLEEGSEVLLQEEIVLVVPGNSPLSSAEQVDLYTLESEDFVGLEPSMVFRDIVDYYCGSIDFNPNYILESDNPSTVRKMIEGNMGISFYPTITWGEMPNNKLKAIRIVNTHFQRFLIIKRNSKKEKDLVVNDFYGFAIDYYKSIFKVHGS